MKTITSVSADHAIMDLDTGISAITEDAFTGLKSTDRSAREEILHRAYSIWESEGHPSDRKLANWLEAEAAVMGHGQRDRARQPLPAPAAKRGGRPTG